MLTKNLINYYEALNNEGFCCFSGNRDIRKATEDTKVISAHVDEISSCFLKGDTTVKFEEDHPHYGHLIYPATFKCFIDGGNDCHLDFNVNPPLSMKDWGVENFLKKIDILGAYSLNNGDKILVFVHEGEAFFAFRGRVITKNFRESTIATIEPTTANENIMEFS